MYVWVAHKKITVTYFFIVYTWDFLDNNSYLE